VAVSSSFCTNLRHCTVLKRAIFAVAAVLLLFALSVERMDLAQDFSGLNDGAESVLVLDDGLGDIQDNDSFLPLAPPPCCNGFAMAAAAAFVKPPAIQAIYSPELRPPAFA